MLALVGKEGGTEFEHLVQTEVGLQGDVETVVLHTPHIALLVVVACGDVVVGIVASAGNTGVVLLVEHVAEEDVVPVGVDGAQTVDALLCLCREGIPTTSLVGVELTQFIENVRHPTLVLTVVVVGAQEPEFEIDFLVGIEQIETVDAETGAVGVFGGEVHHRTPHLAFLGGDDDDAVGGTRSVDGGCGSVFQHGDVVDVGGVEPCNAGLVDVIDVVEIVDGGNLVAFHGDAVEHPKGLLHTVDGGCASNADLGWRTWRTCGGHGGKTCHLTCQCLVDVLDGTDGLIRNLHLRHGSGEFAAVNLLITCHNDFAESLRRTVKGHIISVLIGLEHNGLGLISHITDGECLDSGKHGEGEVPVHVGGRALGTAFAHNDVGTNERFALKLAVHHGPCDGALLCHSRKDGKRHHQQEHQRSFHIHHILYYIL